MGKEVDEQEVQKTAEQMSDIDVAEEASKMLKEKDKEIAKLKKDLAIQKLYTQVEPEEETQLTRDECIKRLSAQDTTNYDYAEAVVRLSEIEVAQGHPHPLGEDGEAITELFRGILEDCNGDKSLFPSIYKSRVGADRPEDLASYRNSLK